MDSEMARWSWKLGALLTGDGDACISDAIRSGARRLRNDSTSMPKGAVVDAVVGADEDGSIGSTREKSAAEVEAEVRTVGKTVGVGGAGVDGAVMKTSCPGVGVDGALLKTSPARGEGGALVIKPPAACSSGGGARGSTAQRKTLTRIAPVSRSSR
jgi:hypothetical protein